MKEFNSIKSFAKKAKYCAERLQRISSGSGRIVYKIDDEKVIKLAKNLKGIAQNETESDQYIQTNYSEVVAKCYDWDDANNFWLEMELARKMNANDFKRIVGYPLNGENSIEAWLTKVVDKTSRYRISPEVMEVLNESEFTYALHDLVGSYSMQKGDFFKLNSWGKVLRDGKEAAVLIDFGLSENVWKEYYS